MQIPTVIQARREMQTRHAPLRLVASPELHTVAPSWGAWSSVLIMIFVVALAVVATGVRL